MAFASSPVVRVVSLVTCFGLAAALACGVPKTLERRIVTPQDAATLDRKSPYLKAHLRSGFVYVLENWSWDEQAGSVIGRGQLFDAERRATTSGTFTLPRDSVALFETNVSKKSGAGVALTVMTGVTAAVAVACALNPKACFGSCPTVYASDSSGKPLLQAESFSASIAPGLEATDLDALYRARPTGRDLTLTLTNEALETHVIRYADLLVAPRPPNGRVVFTTDGQFRQVERFTAPSLCAASDGDCRAAVASFDGRERSTPSDSSDLGARETVDLEFDRAPAGPIGLVVSARQSLMTTYLIYQALAFMGTDATRWLASLKPQSVDTARAESIVGRLLGRIEVLVADSSGRWQLAGETGETGPIAADTRFVPIPTVAPGAPLRVRLRMTKGLWRLDWVSLAAAGAVVRPTRIAPRAVRRGGVEDSAALAALTRRASPLTTLPGDAYQLDYRLPETSAETELFFEARGYYLEWMRQEWLAETNPRAAARLLLDPAEMLRSLARPYKRQEATMDSLFWNSRYAKP